MREPTTPTNLSSEKRLLASPHLSSSSRRQTLFLSSISQPISSRGESCMLVGGRLPRPYGRLLHACIHICRSPLQLSRHRWFLDATHRAGRGGRGRTTQGRASSETKNSRHHRIRQFGPLAVSAANCRCREDAEICANRLRIARV